MASNTRIFVREVDVTNAVRRVVTNKLSSLLFMRSATGPLGNVTKRTLYVPTFVLRLPQGFRGRDTRYLSPFSTRQKGKRRIYCDTKLFQTPNDVFLSYLSGNDLLRMSKDDLARTDESTAKVIDSLGNRWCVTVAKPAAKFDNLVDLLKQLVMVENKPSRSNHPPVGSTKTKVWTINNHISSHISGLRVISPEILCSVEKFDASKMEDKARDFRHGSRPVPRPVS